MQAIETVIGYDAAKGLDDFTIGYIQAAIWSSTDETDDNGGHPPDEKYTIDNIAPASLETIRQACEAFQTNSHLWEADGVDDANAGHDFWLTRNHHGTGYWDGDY